MFITTTISYTIPEQTEKISECSSQINETKKHLWITQGGNLLCQVDHLTEQQFQKQKVH